MEELPKKESVPNEQNGPKKNRPQWSQKGKERK